MYEKILQFILALALVVITRYAVPAIKAYLESKNAGNLTTLIEELVAAAEQLFPQAKQGEKKLEYVMSMLEAEGVTVSNAVRAKIESAVYKLGEKNA